MLLLANCTYLYVLECEQKTSDEQMKLHETLKLLIQLVCFSAKLPKALLVGHLLGTVLG